MFDIEQGDCLDVMRGMSDASVTAIVTDPPYALEFMGKGWDKVLPPDEVWREALRVLKPGGMLLSFGGTRTFHRLTCSLEDAGFQIRDCLCWLYGSGFPKSLDVSKAIDKAAGAERETGPIDPARAGRLINQAGTYETDAGWSAGNRKVTIDPPATDAARLWDGYGTALKPAWEPIILAMKPLDGTFAANALEHGVAGINVDGGRVAKEVTGRWPANVVHGGIDEEWSRFFYCAKASKKDRGPDNTHPTVKPLELMRWLVRMVKMPEGTVILDPFMGSGSTGIACVLEKIDFLGIEQDSEYIEIAWQRLETV